MLNTVRWAGEIHTWTELKLPAEGRNANGLKDAELTMAAQLISEMTAQWNAEQYADQFTAALRKLIEQRAAAGNTQAVEPLGDVATKGASNVVDLTALLAQSLKGGASSATRKPAERKAPARKTAARKRA
jgi:DNA end-binding protein Ku